MAIKKERKKILHITIVSAKRDTLGLLLECRSIVPWCLGKEKSLPVSSQDDRL